MVTCNTKFKGIILVNVIFLQFVAVYVKVKVKVEPNGNIRHFLDVSEMV